MPESAQIEQLIRELGDASSRAEDLRGSRATAELLRRPAERRWSPAECIEHLNLTNRAYLSKIDEALTTLREKNLKADGPFRLEWNARLLKYWLEPPSRLRLPTSPPFHPVEVKDAAAAFGEFIELNSRLAERLESARGLDLSAAKLTSPFSEKVKYSVYSAFALITAHNRRHLWQAERALNSVRHTYRAPAKRVATKQQPAVIPSGMAAFFLLRPVPRDAPPWTRGTSLRFWRRGWKSGAASFPNALVNFAEACPSLAYARCAPGSCAPRTG